MNAIVQALLWLDADTARFWTVAWATFIFVTAAAAFPARGPGASARWNQGLFAGGVVLVIAAFHWPAWFYPTDLNPDEAQMIASAITLDVRQVYWKYVDGTTHGPWCEYFLLLAHWLGAPLNYATARIVATVLQAASIIAVWGTLRCFTTERIARLATLPGLAFWAFVSWDDFIHYSSEAPVVFFLALAIWPTAAVLRAPVIERRHWWCAGLAGFCLGNAPFAKLQAVPAALTLVVIMLGFLWRARTDLPAKIRLRLAGIYIAGGLFPAFFVGGFLTIFGLWNQFNVSYISSALAYVASGQHSFLDMPNKFFHFATTEPAFAWFFWGSLAFALIYLRAEPAQRAVRWGIVASWLLLGATYYSVLRPLREVAHYLHLLVIPTTLIAGFSLAAALDETGRENRSGIRRALPWIFFALVALAPQVWQRAISWHRFVGFAREYHQRPPSEAARFIRDHARPDDAVAMWGWEPKLLVETGMPHGTREPHSAYQMTDWHLRPFFVARYVRDMESRQPAWFVDAVGPDAFVFTNRDTFAHESVEPLNRVITADYTLVAEFKNLRVYHRKDAQLPP